MLNEWRLMFGIMLGAIHVANLYLAYNERISNDAFWVVASLSGTLIITSVWK